MPGDKSARLVHPLRLPALVGRLRPPGGGAPETEPPVSVRAGAIAGAVDPVPRGPSVDWPALLPDVARRLLGEPHRARADEWRYGNHGSLLVHPERGTWHDFEADAGGGTLALIEHVAGAVWPGTRYSPTRHGRMLWNALREVHSGKVAWSEGDRGALRVLVTVHDWQRSFAHNAPLAFGVMLPPGSRQGAQIDRYAVRGTWHSYRQNRLLLVAYCLFDRYGTIAGRMIAPTLPVVHRDPAGYVLGASGKVLTERGRPSRRATHPRAVQTGQREPNPEALRTALPSTHRARSDSGRLPPRGRHVC